MRAMAPVVSRMRRRLGREDAAVKISRQGSVMRAELDLIGNLAASNNDVVLAERAEEVRRKETQRFNDVMQDLRQQVWEQQVAETP